MKIVLCGPPHSGKSCLREGLKQALTEHAGAPYPYVITANPDGEGAWFQAAVSLDREQAMQHKAVYKGFSPKTLASVRRTGSQTALCRWFWWIWEGGRLK